MRALCAALLLLACTAAAQVQTPQPAKAKLAEYKWTLDYDVWPHRISALYGLGELGRDALPLLCYAADDADWQVRLTAVHFLGKAGAEAVPALAEVARQEGCPHIRLSALRWLASLGEAGQAVYRSALTPEDESVLEKMPGRAGLEDMGRPIGMDPAGELTAMFFNGGIDLRVCATSEYSGRYRKEALCPQPQAEPPAPKEEIAMVLPTALEALPSPPAALDLPAPTRPAPETRAQKRLNKEVDKLLALGEPQSLPAAGPGLARSAPTQAEPGLQSLPARRLEPSAIASALGQREELPAGPPGAEPRQVLPGSADIAAVSGRSLSTAADSAPLGQREEFPAGPAAPYHEAAAPGKTEIAADAGTAKPENDPVPALIKALSRGDARRRARAADELGKRGAAALPAVPALRRALKDRDRRVRASAALALGGVGASDENIIADLTRALKDKEEDVRFSAGLALNRLRWKR